MKSAANKIATGSQSTRGVEGYVYDGADGSQMAFWTCHENADSAPHVHEYDEYMVVVQGCYTLVFEDRYVPVKAGEEYISYLAESGMVARSALALEPFLPVY